MFQWWNYKNIITFIFSSLIKMQSFLYPFFMSGKTYVHKKAKNFILCTYLLYFIPFSFWMKDFEGCFLWMFSIICFVIFFLSNKIQNTGIVQDLLWILEDKSQRKIHRYIYSPLNISYKLFARCSPVTTINDYRPKCFWQMTRLMSCTQRKGSGARRVY